MKNIKGFALTESLLILVIVGLLGGTGWYVWQSKNKTNKTLTDTSKVQTGSTSDNNKQKTSADQEYKGKFISFKYPKDWALTTKNIFPANIDESVSLKSANYKAYDSSASGNLAGTSKEGAIISISVMKTTATTVQSVEASYIRGSVLQSKIENNEVGLKNVTFAGIKASEFWWRYEGPGSQIVEFVNNGLFVHASLSTANADEATSQPEYQTYLQLLNTIKLQ